MGKQHENRFEGMRATLLALCAIVSIACLTFESSATATTGPAPVFHLQAVMTDSKITIVRDQ